VIDVGFPSSADSIGRAFCGVVHLTDRVSAASVKAGAAGASRATARGAVGVTAKLVGCIR